MFLKHVNKAVSQQSPLNQQRQNSLRFLLWPQTYSMVPTKRILLRSTTHKSHETLVALQGKKTFPCVLNINDTFPYSYIYQHKYSQHCSVLIKNIFPVTYYGFMYVQKSSPHRHARHSVFVSLLHKKCGAAFMVKELKSQLQTQMLLPAVQRLLTKQK